MAFLNPDKVTNINGVTVKEFELTKHNPNKIAMPHGERKKTVAITIHNTEAITPANGTTMAEQYTRATYYGNMKDVRVQFYVDDKEAWLCMPLNYVNWSCADKCFNDDGTLKENSGNNTSIAIEVIGNSAKAEDNAARLAAYYIKEYNLTVDEGLRTHTYWLNVLHGKSGSIDQLNVMWNSYKNCLPVDSTELLTPSGWKSLKDIKKGDLVAQYDKGNLEFVPTIDVVPPYEAEVIKSRHLEATPNHRMLVSKYNTDEDVDKEWADVIDNGTNFKIHHGGDIITEGLDISDDELLLLAWIQDKGDYITNSLGAKCGIEFHVKKKNKIDRIHTILKNLDIAYTDSMDDNNVMHIRIYNSDVVTWVGKWLKDKKFTYDLIYMNTHQFEIFLDELTIIEGSKNDKQTIYYNNDMSTLDFVQILCTVHNVRTSISPATMPKKGDEIRPACLTVLKANASFRNTGCEVSRLTQVSCVTVPSSYILIRQERYTFVVGNCPIYIIPHWSSFKSKVKDYYNALVKPTTPTTPSTPTVKPTTPTTSTQLYRVRKSWNDVASQLGAYSNLENAKSACKEGYSVFDSSGKSVYTKQKPVAVSTNITTAEIKNLQTMLNSVLILRGQTLLTVDGIIGPKTLNAVKQYTVESSDRGNLISWVQTRLNKLGFYKGGIDGVAGVKTMEAIYAWQKAHGLGQGYLGGSDWNVLLEYKG